MSKDDEIANLKQQLEVEKLHWIEDDRDLNELVDERNKLKKQLEEANKRNEFLESDSIKQEDLLEQTRLALEERDTLLTENKQLLLDKEILRANLSDAITHLHWLCIGGEFANQVESFELYMASAKEWEAAKESIPELCAAMLDTETKQGR